MYNEPGIYCYKNKINGKLYIGQAQNLKKRYFNFLNINRRYAGQVIENARKKYGINNFEYSVLTHCSADELNYWETFYIERLNTVTPHGYNMTNGGDSVYTSTREFKEKQTEKLKEIILSKNPILDVSKILYENHVSSVIIICPIHGQFKKTPNTIFNKQTNDLLCPYCLRESIRQKTEDIFFKKAYEKWGHYYDYSKTIINNHKSKITVICPIHGKFEVLAHNHISNRKNVGGCPKCSEVRVHNHLMKEGEEKLVKFIKTKWGDLYSLDKFVYKGDKKKITLICPKHGEFSIRPNNLKHSYGCPRCSVETIFSRKHNASTNNEVFINLSKKIHGDKYDYSKVEYVNNKTKVCIICSEHGEFWQLPCNHLHGFGCPKCGQKYQKERKIILQYSLNGEFIREWANYDEIVTCGITSNPSKIISCCTGKRNKAYGFKWKYKESKIFNPIILQLTTNNISELSP